jgi:hypothetical protein
MGAALTVTALAALTLGFIAGLVALRRSSRWCPGCGDVLRCVRCAGQPTPRESLARLAGRR